MASVNNAPPPPHGYSSTSSTLRNTMSTGGPTATEVKELSQDNGKTPRQELRSMAPASRTGDQGSPSSSFPYLAANSTAVSH